MENTTLSWSGYLYFVVTAHTMVQNDANSLVARWGLQVYRQNVKSHVLEIGTNHLNSKTTYLEDLIQLSHMNVRST